MKKLAYMLVYATAPALIAGLYFGGWAIAATPILLFLILPTLDEAFGHNLENPTEEDEAGRPFDWLYTVPLWLWVPLEIALITWGMVKAPTLGLGEFAALAAATGLLSGGIGLTIAHELMHRKENVHRALAEVLMHCVSYPHFCIEHVYGHHRNVATPLDPATSRLGEGLYRYLPRTLAGGLRSAVHIERRRTERGDIPWYSPKHRLTRYGLTAVILYAGIGIGLGPVALAFFALQSAVAVFLLETINYVEHYGLQRERKPSGRYERVQPQHSWNANHKVTGYWLFNLQRHADHHAYASRPYHLLRTSEEGPQLPFGYPTMLLVALVPPLWRRMMDPRVKALRGIDDEDDGDVSLSYSAA